MAPATPLPDNDEATPATDSLAPSDRPVSRSVDDVLLDDVAARQPLLAVINVTLSAIVAGLYWPVLPGGLVLGWLGGMVVSQGLRLLVWRWSGHGKDRHPLPRTAQLIVGSALGGTAWGFFGVLFEVHGSLLHEVMRPFVLAGMVAGSVISLPAHLASFFAFFVPALTPFAVALLLDPAPQRRWMGVITIGFGVGISMVAVQMHAILARSIGVGLRNGELLGELRDIQLDLEERVRTRTGELSAANTALLREVEERRRSEAQVRFLLQHDALTGIANRLLFHDRLAQGLAKARRDRGGVAVLMIDLDGFKGINDSLGHGVGDQVLVAVAERLRANVRAGDTVARLGGDEFAVVAGGIASTGAALSLARKLRGATQQSLRLDGRDLVVGLTIGVALHPQHGDDPEVLLRRADLALYRAKEARLGLHLFDDDLEQLAVARRAIEGEMRRGLQQGEFRLHYQARFHIGSGRVLAAEALARWQHPERGLLPPSEFIPAAEASGLIRPLGAWVLGAACRQAAIWAAQGHAMGVSVNISPAQLRDADAVALVVETLRETGLPAARLELELTESLYFEHATEQTRSWLEALRRHGISLAIDDFGTGYASLAYLRNLPFDVVKVDRSFVGRIGRHREDEAIVRSVVMLAQGLGRRVVAEGVETDEQLHFLRRIGCDEAQGFLLARPAAAEAMAHLVA